MIRFARPSATTRSAAMVSNLALVSILATATPDRAPGAAAAEPRTPPTTPTSVPALTPASAPPSAPTPRKLAAGRHVFEQHCQVCHGRRGNGRGDLARGMAPRPRDFTLGQFKFRSTPSGMLPTEADLLRTVRGGLGGSAMPAFTTLPDSAIRSVIAHLQTLSPRWTNAANHAQPVPIPSVPDGFSHAHERAERARRGRPLFEATCAPCHGPAGAGDGPSAAALVDLRGDPCPPRNLRTDTFRRGLAPTDLYRLLVTGLDGTPMPSFADTTDPDQRWDLVAYLLALRASSAQPPG